MFCWFRVRLSKRRAQGGAGGVRSAVSKLVVKHREMNDNEMRAQVGKKISVRNMQYHRGMIWGRGTNVLYPGFSL